MSKITLTYEFDTHDELLEFFGGPKPPTIECNPEIKVGEGVDPDAVGKMVSRELAKQTLGEELEEDAAKVGPRTALTTESPFTAEPPPPMVPVGPEEPPVSQTVITEDGLEEVDLDSDGLPWDARIHSSSKKMTKAKGQWARRKNITDGYKAQIEAEIRIGPEPVIEQPATQATPPPPPPVTVDTTPAIPPPPPTTEPPVNQFELLQRLNAHFEGGVKINEFLAVEFNLASIPALIAAEKTNPTIFKQVSDKLKEVSGG